MGTLKKIVAFLVVSLFTLTGTLKLMPFPSASIHYELVSLWKQRFYGVCIMYACILWQAIGNDSLAAQVAGCSFLVDDA